MGTPVALACGVVAAALFCAGCRESTSSAKPPAVGISFDDVTGRSGVQFVLKNGATGEFLYPELTPGGIGVIDFDRDGCPDLFFANGAATPAFEKTGDEFDNRLFRNRCDGTFTDVTRQAGVRGVGYSLAAAVADYDNDGFEDLFVAGLNRNQLLRNRRDGTFEDVTERAGLSGHHEQLGKLWSMAAGWFDADNDGHLDLFVGSYVRWRPSERCKMADALAYCHPDTFAPSPSQLFHNNGDGTFRDISARSGIGAHEGKAMGVAFADFNRDDRLDVFVTNDTMRNFLFENRGGLSFAEVGLELGVAYGENGRAVAGMGTDFRDVDNDGLPDIVLSTMINDTYLYFRNLGSPAFIFDDATIVSGLARSTRLLTGWGLGLIDVDNDGWKDLFTANSHFPQLTRSLGSSPLPNSLIRNTGRGQFEVATPGAAFEAARYHRGAAFADFDRDGRIDIVVTAINAPAALLRNTSPPAHWIAFDVEGTKANRSGLGAEISLTLADGRTLTNHATTSVGYASSSERLVRFGLGASTIVSGQVRWPGGRVQSLGSLQPDRIVKVVEGR